jgi:hypothetical protein
LSTAVLAFSAAEPKSAVPAAQAVTGTVTGTINGTTLHILITAAGDVVNTISTPVISGTSGSALVTPVAPMALGTGSFSGSLTVRACVDSPTCATGELAGSPRTINVTYSIGSSVQQDAVVPHVVAVNAEGTVLIRGTGLAGVTSVSFGGNAGGIPTVRSATEVSVSYPSMLPGTYAVALNGGTIPFTGSLVVAESPAFAEAVLTYPETPTEVSTVVYDAERRALLVALQYNDPNTNRVLRYTFDGANWSAPTSSTILRLRDIALSNRGDRLLLLREYEMVEADPVSLAMINQTTNSALVGNLIFMRHLALTNDGHALITTDLNGSGATDVYLYSLTSRTFTNLRHYSGSVLNGTAKSIGSIFRGLPGGSGDGSRIVIVPAEGYPPPPLVLQYSAGNGRLTETAFQFAHSHMHYRPALDRGASRIVLSNGTQTPVHADDYSVFCSLPGTTRAYAVSDVGSRAFTVDNAVTFRAFSLATNGGPCLQEGTDIALAFDPGIDPPGFGFPRNNVRMAVSPDGATVFMAGVNGVLVKPSP